MEKKSFIQVIKENKKGIIKKALIVGGSIVGVVVAAKLLVPSMSEETKDGQVIDFLDYQVNDDETKTEAEM